jgi:hypothetical protein
VTPPRACCRGGIFWRSCRDWRETQKVHPWFPDLPRSGSLLAYVVQVLLKTNDEEKRDFLKHFIHQANVNRDKVFRCILGMKAREHRAYVHMEEAKVRKRATQLPANGMAFLWS